ncbi:fibroblast growth factor receptor 1-like isoform X2 [Planococcus citri]|uniref:fibroblast growth factor receptor 1-like isoform X2 n=1 Tax=Planococcus citri TaxID=170843 RepID=UPI0031F7CCF9
MKNYVFFSIVISLLWMNVEADSRSTPKPPNCPNNATECAPQFSNNLTSGAIREFSELKENAEQEFICPQAYGNPTPNITWYKNNIRLNESKSRWTVYSLKFDQDQGNYTCVVCNGLGCIKHTFRVSIKREDLRIDDGPKNATKKIGEKYELKCQHNAPLDKPNGLPRIEWFYGTSDPVDPDKGPNDDQYKTRQDNETTRALVTSTPEVYIKSENQTGWYTCGVITREKPVYKSAFLKVEPKDVENPIVLLSFSGGIILALFLATVVLISYHKFRKKHPNPSTDMMHYISKVIVEIENLSSGSNFDELKSKIIVRIVKIPAPRGFDIEKTPQWYEFPKDENWDFPRERLQLLSPENPLGQGNFGIVYKAEAYGIGGSETWTPVAVKMLKGDGCDDEAVKNFVLETEIMKAIGKHKNIVNLLGVCKHEGKMMVIMEYAARGSLETLLRTQSHVVGNCGGYAILGNNLSELTLLGYALQIAEAMEFLAAKRCIHRDLASRNVLITEDYVMKVADFGLARNVHENYYYRSTTACELPFKWMAPEALFQKKYTTRSDVWSFGITLYEMMSQGAEPYTGLTVDQVVQRVSEGFRLDKPELCSNEIYQLMLDCWSYLPEERPTFTEIKERLVELINNMEQVP